MGLEQQSMKELCLKEVEEFTVLYLESFTSESSCCIHVFMSLSVCAQLANRP